MKTRHAFTVLGVVLLLIPVGLLGMVLLIPVALLLLAALPIVAIAALGSLLLSAAHAPDPAGAPAHAPVSSTVAYPR